MERLPGTIRGPATLRHVRDDTAELREAGVDRQKLYEIITFVGLKSISHYVNHIAGTDVDPQFR